MRKKMSFIIIIILTSLLIGGCLSKGGGVPELEYVSTPVATYSSGTYNEEINVELSSDTDGSSIYYTIDGTDVTINSNLYEGTIPIYETLTLKAIAYKEGYFTSREASVEYVVNIEESARVERPVPSVLEGQYFENQNIEILSSLGATIYYTLDGKDPNESSIKYITPILIDGNSYLKARAYKNGFVPSKLMAQTYEFYLKNVTSSHISGTYETAINVELFQENGARIYYTLDGSEPTNYSLEYSSAIFIDKITTLKTRAYKEGYEMSGVESWEYNISLVKLLSPTSSVESGTYNISQTIALSCESGGEIYYTLDGSDPDKNSTIYTEEIEIESTKILKAKVYKDGYESSEIKTWNYVISNNVSRYEVKEVSSTGTFNYSLEGLNGEEVYFIFTNTKELSPSVSLPTIASVAPIVKLNRSIVESGEKMERKIAQRGRVDITEFNQKTPPTNGENKIERRENLKISRREVGEVTKFYNGDFNEKLMDVTNRKVVDIGTKRLEIWVENSEWGRITQEMVDLLADKFLKDGENDIYGWVTNIFGDEWGEADSNIYIPDNGTISIILYDIDGDKSEDGGVVGFFYSRDNVLKSVSGYETSNERLIFYIDSYMFANGDSGKEWGIDSYWPSEVVSTLAHEFQHMIYYYQREVINKFGSITWINEMQSMLTEELLSDKLGVKGPRGVSYLDGSSGEKPNYRGRVVDFNGSVGTSVAPNSSYNSLAYYGADYVFGHYLLNNYGGIEFLNKLMQTSSDVVGLDSEIGKDILEKAVVEMGYTENFDELLKKWGVAVLLSDLEGVEEGYKYNSGGWNSYNYGGVDYSSGSLNVYNYIQGDNQLATGPQFIDLSEGGNINYLTNVFYKAGSDMSGDYSWSIDGLEEEIIMQVLIKK